MLVRAAKQTDATAIWQLARQFATSFSVEEASFHATLTLLLPDSSAQIYVAELDGVVVGYLLGFDHLTFFANGRVAWVEEIMVAEPHRRCGVGQKLMDAFEEWARQRQCKIIALATRRAAPFYRSIGYQESAAYFRKLL